MTNYTTDAPAVNQEFDEEARYEELKAAGRQARFFGLQNIRINKPSGWQGDTGNIEVYLGPNSPVDHDGKPNQEQRLVSLVVYPYLNGDHTLAKLGIDGLDSTVIVGRDDTRIHFFRVPNQAPKIHSRQLGPGVKMMADGLVPLPPVGDLQWLTQPGNPALATMPDALPTVDDIPPNEDPASRGRFQRVDAVEIARRTIEAPADLGYGLIAAAKVNGFMGPVQSGKTYSGENVAVFNIRQGRKVFWIAHEDEAEDVVDNLLALGAEERDLEHFFIYPTPDATPADARHFQGLVKSERPALVIWDNLATVLSAAGIDENSNTQVAAWYRLFAKSVRKYGVASLILDHTREGNTSEARGARTKRAETDVMWLVKAERPFDEEKTGAIKLTCKKDKAWRKLAGTSRTFKAGGPEALFEDGHSTLSPNQKLMLDALPADGASWADWRKAAAKVGIKPGSVNKIRQALADGGHVQESDGLFRRA
jgi:hypothetical protein